MPEEKLPIGVHNYSEGIQANLMEWSAEHPEARFILYSGSDISDATIWMVSDTIEDEAINALIRKASTKRGFFQMINKESLSYEKLGGFALYGD